MWKILSVGPFIGFILMLTQVASYEYLRWVGHLLIFCCVINVCYYCMLHNENDESEGFPPIVGAVIWLLIGFIEVARMG